MKPAGAETSAPRQAARSGRLRVALVSPMPPARSGIADYSATLAEHLGGIADLEVFTGGPFPAQKFDAAIYQIGNNPHHAFAYETALRHPGVVVLHESNLHHLIADLTIKRGDWDAYLRECEFEGGASALDYARRVRKLETGPDYEGLPMLRRLLGASRALIVHSSQVEQDARRAGFAGPIARIPHGAWLPEADRHAYRHRLGLDELTPLIGIFGFLKPYKRIHESLRAFARLLRLTPNAKLVLAGEPHPELKLDAAIRGLDLSASVRTLGFVPAEEFTGYMAACDIVLNLRYPTVGESSGTLLRALGLGKPVLVSDVGSFAEFPDDICLKVPPGAGEEQLIFEYLNLLVSRPEIARAIGDRAREYVARECNWNLAAARYESFLRCVVEGEPWEDRQAPAVSSVKHEASPVPVQARDVLPWAKNRESREYLETHLDRLVKTLEITPPGGPEDCVLEMGAYLQITPALRSKLGYGCVRGCYYGKAGTAARRSVTSAAGETFECDVDLFDAEKDPFPYADGAFATVLCCELIEHLPADPMHLMAEVNRILRPGGHLVLTTPNIASLASISAVLQGYHPGVFHSYIRPRESGEVEARHNREYTTREIELLLENSGFSVTRLETGPFRRRPQPELGWVLHLLERYQLSTELRGEGIFAVGRKTGPVRERYPGWLYT
jgi:glycosyltransferase involved in cell wall biosynthesis/SAM-dependent methyltransferase